MSPDIKYVLLLSDIVPVEDDEEETSHGGTHDSSSSYNNDDQPPRTMARYHVFEVQARNQFPLSHKDSGVQLAPHLQHVLWAPNSQSITDRGVQRQNHYRQQQLTWPTTAAAGNVVNSLLSSTALPPASVGNVSTRSSIAVGSAESVNSNAGKPPRGPSSLAADPMKVMTGSNGGGVVNNHQAIAFVHENDIYYKPKVQQDLVCRITTTGE